MISNLAVLLHAIAKTALLTGLGPAILSVYAADKLAKRFRVPAPLQGERWSAWRKNLIRFSTCATTTRFRPTGACAFRSMGSTEKLSAAAVHTFKFDSTGRNTLAIITRPTASLTTSKALLGRAPRVSSSGDAL